MDIKKKKMLNLFTFYRFYYFARTFFYIYLTLADFRTLSIVYAFHEIFILRKIYYLFSYQYNKTLGKIVDNLKITSKINIGNWISTVFYINAIRSRSLNIMCLSSSLCIPYFNGTFPIYLRYCSPWSSGLPTFQNNILFFLL